MAGAVIGNPTECDLFRSRGDTKTFVLTVTATDVLGWTGLLTITSDANPADASTLIYQASGVPDTESPITVGKMIFDFSTFAAQSPQLIPGKYFYDVELTDAAALICTVLKGRFEIGQDRTK